MLIHSYILIVSCLFSTHVNAKSGRRKGMLRQPPEFETWTGKWFPFDPTHSMTRTTTTTPAPGKPQIVSANSIDDWTGKWFPFKAKSLQPISPKVICDDGQNSIEIDFDPKNSRHSYNYLCLVPNRTVYKPNFDLEAIQIEHVIPPAYVPPVKCLNESISYNDPVPTFGGFRPLPPKYGTYRYLPPQRWLRSIAEGAIIMLHHPCAFPGQVTLLKNTVQSCMYRHIITPSQSLSAERPLALIAWGKSLQMSVVDEKTVVNFIKSSAKLGPLKAAITLKSQGEYDSGLLAEAKLITDIDDTEICGYKEM